MQAHLFCLLPLDQRPGMDASCPAGFVRLMILDWPYWVNVFGRLSMIPVGKLMKCSSQKKGNLFSVSFLPGHLPPLVSSNVCVTRMWNPWLSLEFRLMYASVRPPVKLRTA